MMAAERQQVVIEALRRLKAAGYQTDHNSTTYTPDGVVVRSTETVGRGAPAYVVEYRYGLFWENGDRR